MKCTRNVGPLSAGSRTTTFLNARLTMDGWVKGWPWRTWMIGASLLTLERLGTLLKSESWKSTHEN